MWIPMVAALVFLYPFYGYNDTILTENVQDDNFKGRSTTDASTIPDLRDSEEDTGYEGDYFRT